jgi:hypothetical protein
VINPEEILEFWEERWDPVIGRELTAKERESFLAREEVLQLRGQKSDHVKAAITRHRDLAEVVEHTSKLRDGFFVVVDEADVYPDRWYKSASTPEEPTKPEEPAKPRGRSTKPVDRPKPYPRRSMARKPLPEPNAPRQPFLAPFDRSPNTKPPKRSSAKRPRPCLACGLIPHPISGKCAC